MDQTDLRNQEDETDQGRIQRATALPSLRARYDQEIDRKRPSPTLLRQWHRREHSVPGIISLVLALVAGGCIALVLPAKATGNVGVPLSVGIFASFAGMGLGVAGLETARKRLFAILGVIANLVVSCLLAFLSVSKGNIDCIVLAGAAISVAGLISYALSSVCPACNSPFARIAEKEETLQEAGLLQREKVRYTYRCRYCGHVWQIAKTIDHDASWH